MAPVDSFKGSLGGVGVKLSTLGGFFRWFAQGLAVEGEAVRGVDERRKLVATMTKATKEPTKFGRLGELQEALRRSGMGA